jgi:uncharacterized coiled-coil protein SlyX
MNNQLIHLQREMTKKNRQLEHLNERLEILATTDALTSLIIEGQSPTGWK